MLKKRIAAVLAIKDGIVVQSIGFKKYLPVGSVGIAMEFLNSWGIDEIIALDIKASSQKRRPDFDLIKEVSPKCFVPLTAGGGIRDLGDIKKLVYCGADRIAINKTALANPKIIKEASAVFGNQCVVVSMDVKNINGKYEVYSDSGAKPTGLDPAEWAKRAEELGCGEILVNSINNDGAKTGFDLELTKRIADAVSIPVIACGGAGHPLHFRDVLDKCGASAAAAGNYFHFTEHSSITLKSFLKNSGLNIRLDTHADYKDFECDADGRIIKKSDQYLEQLRFKYQPKEII